MTTSVKMRSEDKERLDRLQARILAESGKKFSQQELLGRLLRLGEAQVYLLTDRPKKMTKAQRERLLSLPVDTGIETREEDIDRILYGRHE